jgi:tyrosine-protein kinase Etk/Wzc
MSKQKNQVATLSLAGGDKNEAPVNSDLIKKYIYHWPLFVLAMILSIIAGYFYLKHTNPVFPILATLEFKAPTASSASLTVNQGSTQQELDPIDKPIIVENEIEVMQSKKLIYEVVNALQLWVTYNQKKGLVNIDLYKRSPVNFQFLHQEGNIGPKGEKMEVTIKDRNSYIYKDELGNEKKTEFSIPIKSVLGTWQLNTNPGMENFIGKTITISIQDPDLVSDGYQSKIKVALENKDAPFVNLSTSDEAPQRGKDILNSLMDLYLKFAIEDKNKLSQKTLKFIEFRLDSLKTQLDSVERKIEHYRISHNITNIDLQAQSYRDINHDNMKALNDVEVQLGVVAGLEKYINSNADSEKLPAASALLTDVSLANLYDKLADLQLKRDQLLATTPPTNSMFIVINKQISTLKADFKEKLQSIKTALLSQKRQLSTFGKNVQSSLNQVPGEDREYASLQRIQVTYENIYKFLLEKHEQVALRYASSVSDSEVVDDAHAGKVKWPIVPLVYGISLVLGIFLAAGIIFARESLNDLITNRKQIEDKTDIPILGELAFQDTDEQIVVSEGRNKFAIGEQFRVLRTNLFHLHGNNDSGRVTLFTSSVSGEGKSFVSSNLAVTLAYTNRKTIILEMDLRKPKITVNFGLSTEFEGISNYLNDESDDLKKLIRPSGIPYLDLLSCGSILPNPSELLEKDKLDEMINKLKENYDEIIIDSPPIHLVTDALIIARVADTSLYVIRQGYTHKYELDFANEINNANRFPKFSIVFNGVKAGASGYGGYGYGYNYTYGNSYYNSYADKTKETFGDKVKSIFKRF